METLTDRQISRQDFVDNEIYRLIQKLNPYEKPIKWDIEMIADIRDVLEYWISDRLKLSTKQKFYPSLRI